ncbi:MULTISPECIES: pantetheine-phosphate adenylyltransferase [Roseivirga]|jgi:pantetheine-phosphate adenylyltransferase|uniref:Phosphopantetheine adenylyltransferase n=1 Tax=Roseivirga spongicola TaxID=333140 RepID=A0A150XAE3_9BACT|nr:MULTISPECIES: pantetheine-phosphate adenylyltransferase [Roseivirga]PWL29306.1 MAG: pantetheine-phosphate adenylyltransferase [Roseivirga sp. XM-24bin3]KYG75688.1 phosphopantetheine adenylyltransferase [Roseivirga spongicola]MBO6494782.1 pantetheine-phosphate adenylyltransferase [Roseivirga sp.]MBO6662454.1 pantetheine-phosphate adenylyltransferase [Roseivirga sp.]MBO6762709.1 pantetheine-phosphate adenylyltransferase [Roseivirga sp.]
MKQIALFPGSFDPFTRGHEDIVLRGLKIFDEIIVAIGFNSQKNKRYFEIDYMEQKINETFKDIPEVSVIVYSELTASLASKLNASAILRGLRNTTDFEYENSISQVNRDLNKELETIFLITSPELAAVNSSIIREVHRYGGNIDKYIPYTL